MHENARAKEKAKAKLEAKAKVGPEKTQKEKERKAGSTDPYSQKVAKEDRSMELAGIAVEIISWHSVRRKAKEKAG